jgi:hypothetical protein
VEVAAVEEHPTANPTSAVEAPPKMGTTVNVKATFFPDMKNDEVLSFKSLHVFENKGSWISIGFTPKTKDTKVMMEDLKQMDYLKNIEGIKSTIVFDGNKVRMGF